jgi:hypothetical protein
MNTHPSGSSVHLGKMRNLGVKLCLPDGEDAIGNRKGGK